MQLRIPGPTPLPDAVREAGARQMINHRGPAFHAILRDITDRARPFFQTESDILIFPASGTGGLEASLVNCFSPGDTVISLSCGHFGDRYADIAAAHGLEVVRVRFEPGQAVDPARAAEALRAHPAARGLLLTHNETSTGVQNDVAAIGALARAQDVLLLVDSISALGAVDLRCDAWGVDVAVSASQKGWMTPPGLALISVSPRAWQAHAAARLPRYYFDFGAARTYLERWETPYTPAISLLYQLQAALELMHEEGRAAVFARHEALRDSVRGRVRALGLAPLAADPIASRTVTAVRVPDAKRVIGALREQGVELAGGQGALEGRLIRIGHVGWATEADMRETLDSLAGALGASE
jgi:aspartate aminotransferase-like enzyme